MVIPIAISVWFLLYIIIVCGIFDEWPDASLILVHSSTFILLLKFTHKLLFFLLLLVPLEVSLPPRPSQQFIHWRNNNTIHSVHISCPMQLPFRTISWFRNGVRLVNATERDLSRSSSDPAMLYGVYQCLVRSPELESRDILTVTRVMPYGMYTHL